MAGETVLVVDDRQDNLNFLREYILEPNGYEMLTANNGADALALVKEQTVDLIISDLVMPKMGGLELLETLREEGLDIASILMTFHGSEGTAVRAFRLGARDYIIKPFAIDEMTEAIDRALAESRLKQERDRLMQTILQVNQQLESRVQELRFLYGIGRSVSSLRDLKQILNRIVEAAVYLTQAEEGALMLVDERTGDLFLRAARGMGERKAKTLRLRVQDSIVGQVVQTGRPVMMGGTSEDDSFKMATGYFVKAMLNVPLKTDERVIGVLAVNNRTIVKPFDERHLSLLMALADYACIAIQNARLYAQLELDLGQAKAASRELEETVTARTEQLATAEQRYLETEKLAAFGHMANNVANELDAPIRDILDNVTQLSAELAPAQAHETILKELREDALQCQEIIQSLLDFGQERVYNPQETNLNDLVEAAWLRYASADRQNGSGIEFVPQFQPDLPVIPVDRGQMELALYHLIRSACRAMPTGGTLRVISRTTDDALQVVVSDTGPGLAPEDAPHIFEPFYRSADQSHGLDLSIAYRIIERHKGSIHTESDPGEGTRFIVDLPRHL